MKKDEAPVSRLQTAMHMALGGGVLSFAGMIVIAAYTQLMNPPPSQSLEILKWMPVTGLFISISTALMFWRQRIKRLEVRIERHRETKMFENIEAAETLMAALTGTCSRLDLLAVNVAILVYKGAPAEWWAYKQELGVISVGEEQRASRRVMTLAAKAVESTKVAPVEWTAYSKVLARVEQAGAWGLVIEQMGRAMLIKHDR